MQDRLALAVQWDDEGAAELALPALLLEPAADELSAAEEAVPADEDNANDEDAAGPLLDVECATSIVGGRPPKDTMVTLSGNA